MGEARAGVVMRVEYGTLGSSSSGDSALPKARRPPGDTRVESGKQRINQEGVKGGG